jgi:hypothetical protein
MTEVETETEEVRKGTNKMKLNPKIILGTLVSSLIFTSLFLLARNANVKPNKIILDSVQNKFKLSFDINSKDNTEFQNLLKALNLSSSLSSGIELTLDSTSSARLAFAAPIESNLYFKGDKTVQIDGEISSAAKTGSFKIENLRIPDSSSILIFAPDLKQSLQSRLFTQPQLIGWVNKNINSDNGMYLIFFKDNFALFFKSANVEFESLNGLKNEQSQELFYKQDLENEQTFHIINTSLGATSFVIFETDGWRVVTNSKDSAKIILDDKTKRISDLTGVQEAIFLVELTNEKEINQLPFEMLFGNSDKINPPINSVKNSISSIKKLSFVLNERTFSGLINLK